MSDFAPKQTDARMVLAATKDFLIAVAIGLAGWRATVALLQAYLAPKYAQFVWYEDFASLMGMIAAVTIGGLAYAVILHRHSKRDVGK